MDRLASKNGLTIVVLRYVFIVCITAFVGYSFIDSERWSSSFFIYGGLSILMVSALLNIKQLDQTFTGFVALPVGLNSLQGWLYILAMIALFVGLLYGK